MHNDFFSECIQTDSYYTECVNAKCWVIPIMLIAIMMSVIIVVMLSGIMLVVMIWNVAAPKFYFRDPLASFWASL